MHLIENYALSCGVKIRKPFIRETFFPNIFDQYIILHPYSKPSKSYDYWQEVLNLILPELQERKIQVIQIGVQGDQPLNGAAYIAGMTNPNQVAYLLRGAKLHLGADSFPTHMASSYDKKIVALYSNNHLNCVKPYFGSPENQILLEPDRKGNKPNFSLEENPKTINSIPPEKIAQAVFDLLKIDVKILNKTINFGLYYNRPSFETIPTSPLNTAQFQISNVIVRMDYHSDLQVLAAQLQICPCLIMSDKPVDKNLITQFRANIPHFFYKITKESDPKYVEFIQGSNIPYDLITEMSDEDLRSVKLDYLDYKLIQQLPKKTKEHLKITNCDNVYYKSSKRLYHNGKIYDSKASFDAGIEFKDGLVKVIDNEAFWKESEHFYIYSL